MMNKNDQQWMAQKIRAQYMEKQPTELDTLRELDARVRRPASVFAYIFGSISAIIMGCGMSLVMTEIGDVIGMGEAMIPGIAVGVVGMAMALLTYPIYNAILKSRKKKYGEKILTMSEQIMKNQ